ncbi:hypothetical protein [Mycobacterium lehmannii]|uniref:hypothetical protein n=1 Tax=Mycobacterium lehmannii TaxID=2048550 RepID=UPI000B942FD5|nr:hypothetical protein [Mycobacterium lehmannii]
MPAVPGAAKPIEVVPAEVSGTAQSIAGEVTRAAQPGAVPMPGVGSTIDVAANSVAVAVAKNIAQASATLAPEPVEGVQKAETAMTEFRGQDVESAADIKSVSQGMEAMPPVGASGSPGIGSVRPAGFSPSSVPEGPWGLDDDEWELDEWGTPQPIWPGGDGGGGAAGGGVGGVAPI